jgi:hypothetical protein
MLECCRSEATAQKTVALAHHPTLAPVSDGSLTGGLSVPASCFSGLHASPVLKDSHPFGRAHMGAFKVGDLAPCDHEQHRASELVTIVA